ncbi:MAG: CHAT domain-containing protein [Sphingopyxis sp.]|uniref:CHAT domain-containing tetratricopeptide repeat protein n=1 Tax=Sphingopyxis sp. TaxID=1908224 RepID=UPI001A438A1D|nr:CHAT domain-containing tetratricopeptide repeat protein [Sphingopyxis sp.]MBL9071835.1 CHAT domain-containing protein [Sphingopyxis sp.]
MVTRGIDRTVWVACFAAALACNAAAWAQDGAIDRSRLEALTAQFDAATADADPAGYRALADETLAEAKRLHRGDHPDIALGELHVAMALASSGDMDAALALVDRAIPRLEADPAYRGNWRNAIGARAYILNFKGEHAAALALNERLIADYEAIPEGRKERDYATTLSNLAASYLEHGRLDDALARNRQAIDIALTLDPVPPDVAIWNANRVVYLYSAGRTEKAIATAQDAIARVGPAIGPDHPMMANLYANLGAILLRVNRPHDAMPMIRHAYELTEGANGGPNQNSAAMRVQFAQALIRAGRDVDAIAFLDAATPIIDAQLGAQSDRALVARDTRLIALLNTGHGAEAEPLARELIGIRDARLPEGHRDRANARENLAKAAFVNAAWQTAEQAAAEAVALRDRMLPPEHPDLLLARAMLLRAQDRADRRPPADLLMEARALFRALTLNANLARGSAQAERQRPAYGWLAELFARRGAVEDAFEAQQWAARSSIDDALAIVESERAVTVEPEFAAAVATRRQLLAARQGLEAKLDANLMRPDAAFDLAGLARELDNNRRAIGDLDATLSAAQRARLTFTPATLAQFAGPVTPRSASVMFTDLGPSWLATMATDAGTRQYLIPDGAALASLVGRLRTAIDGGAASDFDPAAATMLYARLFPGEADTMLKGTERLAVIANGSLGALPFGMLMPGGKRGPYLIDRMAISRLVRAPQGARAETGAGAIDTLVALGGVEGRRTGERMAMRSGGAAHEIAELPDLPDAQRELGALAEALGTGSNHLLIGDHATEAGLRAAAVPPGSVLAFATHGLLPGDFDGLDEPALLLNPAGEDDGLLKPSEIGSLSLPARLVILSACNSAGAAGADRPQLSGLVQGFFLAGADEVMASHWPVRDDIARRLSVGMVGGMRAGETPAEALRAAILTVRKGNDGEAKVDNPGLWAPFELFSG